MSVTKSSTSSLAKYLPLKTEAAPMSVEPKKKKESKPNWAAPASAARRPLDGFDLTPAPAPRCVETKVLRMDAEEVKGRLPAPAQKSLTVASNALKVDEKDRLPAIELEVDARPQRGATDCKLTADAALHETLGWSGHTETERIQIATNEDVAGRVQVRPEALARGRIALDQQLEAGQPVIVGVSHTNYDADARYNEGVTDHFVVVKGRGYDDAGRLYYEFMDPGALGRTRRFHVDAESGKLFMEGNEASTQPMLRPFEVSQVRVYEPTP